MDLLEPTSGEKCQGCLKASHVACCEILSRSNPLSTQTASQDRMESNLKGSRSPSGSSENESEDREGTDFSDAGHSRFLLEGLGFPLDVYLGIMPLL